MGLFNKKKKETKAVSEEIIQDTEIKEEPIEVEKEQKELLFITDHKKDGINEYLRSIGTNITVSVETVEELKDILMFNQTYARLVICETGTGKFIATKIREDIIDMLGMCDSNVSITIFYTDTVFKSDIARRLSNIKIDWFMYETTLKMGITLSKYNEDYIAYKEETEGEREDIGGIVGDAVEHEDDITFNARLDISRIALEEEDLIEGYEVTF